jgi:hypothetical protein
MKQIFRGSNIASAFPIFQKHFQHSLLYYNNCINTIFIKKAIIITAVNSWIRTIAKLLFFDNPHFLPGNPHSRLLLLLLFGNLSTLLLKQFSVKRVHHFEFDFCGF